jgi:hypothetical protein
MERPRRGEERNGEEENEIGKAEDGLRGEFAHEISVSQDFHCRCSGTSFADAMHLSRAAIISQLS